MELPPDAPDTPYRISYHDRDVDRAIVVFSGGIFTSKGAFPEQFRASLEPFGCAMIFVHEHPVRIFKNPHVPRMFEQVAALARRYRHVSVLGESMGAIGALLFGGLCPEVDRVLALSAPFCAADPFARFDPRFRNIASSPGPWPYWLFGSPEVKPKAQLVYSNTDWADTVHASMFMAEGYDVSFVNGGGHLLAGFLKGGLERNLLADLLRPLVDGRERFDKAAVQAALGPLYRERPDTKASNLEGVLRAHAQSVAQAPPPAGTTNIAKGRKTDQSSISEWSRGRTTQADSAGAVSGVLTGGYAFHTDREDRPWWAVDLGAPATIAELRIYNRVDDATVVRRGIRFAVEASGDGQSWREVLVKDNDESFAGSLHAQPFVWRPAPPLTARHLRIRLLVEDFMHYEQVEVYGRFVDA